MIVVNIPLPPKAELRARYDEQHDSYERLIFEIQRRTQAALRNCGLRATTKYRVKSFDSLYSKLIRLCRSVPPDATNVEVTDIVALRIVCPFLEDVALAERCLRAQYQVSEVDRKGSEFSVREFGYESVHCLIRVPDDVVQSLHLRAPFECEIQIRTILQDAWAEVEHELVYKADATPFDDTVQRKLAALNANLSLSDITFQEIREYQRRLHSELQKRRQGFWEIVSNSTGGTSPGNAPGAGDRESVTFGVSRDANGAESVPAAGARSAWNEGVSGLDSLLLEALQAHNEGRFDRADEVYTRILLANPRRYIRAIVLLHRGVARLAAERHQDALDDIDAALAIDPENLRGRFYRGVLLQMTGRLDDAERELTRCLSNDPYQVECLLQRAKLYAATGRSAKGISDCDRALEIAPDMDAVVALRGELLRSPTD